MTDRWHTGNANDDGAPTRGWIVGNFIDRRMESDPPKMSK